MAGQPEDRAETRRIEKDKLEYLEVYDSSNMSDEYRQHIPGDVRNVSSRTWLQEAAEEILAHSRHRYDLTLRAGMSPFTLNEVMGIIAKHLEASKRST